MNGMERRRGTSLCLQGGQSLRNETAGKPIHHKSGPHRLMGPLLLFQGK